MLEVEEQLRRYGAAVERAADVDVAPLEVSGRRPQSLRWLAAAAALLLVVGVAVAATDDDGDDRVHTADDGADNDGTDDRPGPATEPSELECLGDGLVSRGSGSIGTDASGRVEGAEPTPEAALRRFVEKWTLLRYPAVDEVHDGGDADPQPGYTLEPGGPSVGRSVTYRLHDLRVVGIFGLTEVNDGEGWALTGVSTCFDWSGTLPPGTLPPGTP